MSILEKCPYFRGVHSERFRCITNSAVLLITWLLQGRRYRGERGIHAAATKIQAMCKMYMQRLSYLHYRRMQWAAGESDGAL